jgi:hypothetical protein
MDIIIFQGLWPELLFNHFLGNDGYCLVYVTLLYCVCLTNTKSTWIPSLNMRQVLGVISGSPLCHWCWRCSLKERCATQHEKWQYNLPLMISHPWSHPKMWYKQGVIYMIISHVEVYVIISRFIQKELNNIWHSHFEKLQRLFHKDLYYVYENQFKLTNIETHAKDKFFT